MSFEVHSPPYSSSSASSSSSSSTSSSSISSSSYSSSADYYRRSFESESGASTGARQRTLSQDYAHTDRTLDGLLDALDGGGGLESSAGASTILGSPPPSASPIKLRAMSMDVSSLSRLPAMLDPEWTTAGAPAPGGALLPLSVGLGGGMGGGIAGIGGGSSSKLHRSGSGAEPLGGASKQLQPFWRRHYRSLVRLGCFLVCVLTVRRWVPEGSAARLRRDVIELGEWMERPENLLEGGFVMVVLFVAGTVLSLPIIPLELFAGKVYGFPTWSSFVLSTLGKQVGSVASFVFGRWACRAHTQRAMKSYPIFERLDRAMYTDEVKILFLARSMYGVPAIVKNHFMGALSGTSFRSFFWTALVGDMPHTMFWLYLGSTAESLVAIAEGRTAHGTGKGMMLGMTIFVVAIFALTMRLSSTSFNAAVLRAEGGGGGGGLGGGHHGGSPADGRLDRDRGRTRNTSSSFGEEDEGRGNV